MNTERPKLELLRFPQGSVSEIAVVALISNAKKAKWLTLSDFSDALDKGKIPPAFDRFALSELRSITDLLKTRRGTKNPSSFTITPATVSIGKKEQRVLKVIDGPRVGYAPIPSPMVNEILAECLRSRNLPEQVIDGQRILEIAKEFNRNTTLPEALAQTNKVLQDLGPLIGLNRRLVEEKWRYKLRAENGFNRPFKTTIVDILKTELS